NFKGEEHQAPYARVLAVLGVVHHAHVSGSVERKHRGPCSFIVEVTRVGARELSFKRIEAVFKPGHVPLKGCYVLLSRSHAPLKGGKVTYHIREVISQRTFIGTAGEVPENQKQGPGQVPGPAGNVPFMLRDLWEKRGRGDGAARHGCAGPRSRRT